MAHVLNRPEDFADEMLAGFVAAYVRFVRAAPGGVVRRSPAEGQVAVVVGGGSGHYPAFGGFVGPGLAAAAAMGNVFASPSVQQVYSVASAADTGAGVLFIFGNYMGDVLNFGAAQERMIAEGHSCRTVAVTDDVASAAPEDADRRRGIAGDLAVFKVAGAAAAEGRSLDQVYEAAVRANARTRTFGVAFSGCTLPGAEEPLFTVAPGTMAVGMGIHGEPGLGDSAVPTADGLAELLVAQLLAEVPDGVGPSERRAGVILNGLGGMKYEELFVVYRRVAQLLDESGIEVVDPEVGELVTSFDMAGVSLTVLWLDPDLENLWCAPAASPAFRRGAVSFDSGESSNSPPDHWSGVQPGSTPVPSATEASVLAASVVVECLDAVRVCLDENRDYLGSLDAVAGDGDHGIGMQRGAVAAQAAARDAAARGAGLGTTLGRAGDAWSEKAGGTSGVLWGLMLRSMGDHLGDAVLPLARDVSDAVASALAAVRDLGKAAPGDKTLVDALVPFSKALDASTTSGTGLARAWSSSAVTSQAAATATAQLVPRVGRARPHAERSLGTPDPGAVSLAMVVMAVAQVLTKGAHSHD